MFCPMRDPWGRMGPSFEASGDKLRNNQDFEQENTNPARLCTNFDLTPPP